MPATNATGPLSIGAINGNCGMREILGVHSATVKQFLALPVSKNHLYLFSDNLNGNGQGIALHLRKNKIGRITRGPVAIGNYKAGIRAWLWTPNRDAQEQLPKVHQEKIKD